MSKLDANISADECTSGTAALAGFAVGREPNFVRQVIKSDMELRLRGSIITSPPGQQTVTILLKYYRQGEGGLVPLPSLLKQSSLYPGYELYKVKGKEVAKDDKQPFQVKLLPPPGAEVVEIGMVLLNSGHTSVHVEINSIDPAPQKPSSLARQKRGAWAREVLGRSNLTKEFVSVIIPVYNDPEGLSKCLRALAEQEPRGGGHEIIVVDNASTTDIRSVVESFPGVTYLLHTKPGSYSSRNFGALHAKGAVLAFTDADCVPQKDWLRCGVYQLLNANTPRIVTGRIELTWNNGSGPETIAGWWERLFGFNYQRLGMLGQPYIRHGVTASMFMLRDTFDRLNGFTEDHYSGGDTDFSNRCNAIGIKVRFEKEVVVAHPARESTRALLKKRLRIFSNLYYRELHKADNRVFPYFFNRLLVSWRKRLDRVEAAGKDVASVPTLRLKMFMTLIMVLKGLELLRLRVGGEARRA